MLIENALIKLLTEDAGVAAIVDGRIYPIWIPQSPTYPLIGYELIDRSHFDALDGLVGLAVSTFAFYSTAQHTDGIVEATKLDTAIRLALANFRGLVTDEAVSPQTDIFIQKIMPLGSVPARDDATQRYQMRSVFEVTHSEPTPS